MEREVRKREDALSVPREKEVFVFKEHFWDDGGPRPLSLKAFKDDPEGFQFVLWRDKLKSASENWEPVEIVPDDDPELPSGLPVGDYSAFNGLMIFSERAASALQHLLLPCGVLLRLVCESGGYVGFRLDAEVDALDVDKTKASWHPGKQAASSVYTYAFRTEQVGSAAIYRVPHHYEILVNHEFVETVRSHGFTGFRFCRVWPTAMATLWWYENWC